MHELSLCREIVGLVGDRAAAEDFDRIIRIRLEIGSLSCVEPEALSFCFESVALGTPAEGAVLDIREVPGQAWCRACRTAVPIQWRGDPCPACGGYGLRVSDGDGVRIKELEVQ